MAQVSAVPIHERDEEHPDENFCGSNLPEARSPPDAACVPLPTFQCSKVPGAGSGDDDGMDSGYAATDAVLRAGAGQADMAGVTLVMQNMPARATCNDLLRMLHDSGFQGVFKYMFMPMKVSGKKNKGFAFVGFERFSQALLFHDVLEGASFSRRPSTKAITLSVAKQHIPADKIRYHHARETYWGLVIAG